MAMILAAARVNARLTQEEVCKALGMHKNTLASYEAYKTKPDIDRAKQLAALYGCELDDIKWSEDE
jgi:transcriptional regulator with XRE-family HTH domain